MAKKKPKPVRVRRMMNPERAAYLRRALAHTFAALACLALLSAGFYFTRNWVEKRVVFSDRAPKVVLKNRPAWMSDFLVGQITAAARPVGTHSAFDHQLLVDVTAMLKTNPWIRHVNQVRRAYDKKPGDTIEIDCDWRAPIALVHWQDYYWLVDGDGVKLPEQYTAGQVPLVMRGQQSRRVEIRIIEGVTQPPVESGRKWVGDDLMSGIELVKVLHGLPYADEIERVDVSNFDGRNDRREAHLKLLTRYNTEIRWGRPVSSKDSFIEVSTAQKLDYLKQVYEQFHRVDGNQPAIDIRFDRITYPSGASSATPTAQADGRR